MKRISSVLAYLLSSTAFNNPAWKLDADGKIEMKDGNPIYIDSNGAEMTIATDTISKRNAEAKSHRERADAAEKALKAFEGLDPEKAREALGVVEKLDKKKLIDAGEVDKVREEIQKQYTGQLTEKDTLVKTLQEKLDNNAIDAVFANSEFVRDSIAVPRDMFEATFRKNFKVENGEVVAIGKDGNRLFSKSKAGEYATAEEALRILVEGHSSKDTILKANPGSGSGGNGGNGGGKGGGKVIKRDDFAKLTPHEQSTTSAKIRAGEMQMVD